MSESLNLNIEIINLLFKELDIPILPFLAGDTISFNYNFSSFYIDTSAYEYDISIENEFKILSPFTKVESNEIYCHFLDLSDPDSVSKLRVILETIFK